MKRKVLVPVAIIAGIALAGGAAMAAFNARLKGRGTMSTIAFQWDTSLPVGSNDRAGMNDPVGPGTAPLRESYDVGVTEGTFDGDTLVLSTTDAYDGYRWTYQGFGGKRGAGSGAFKVQGVTLQRNGGDPFTPGNEIRALIDPTLCGATVPTYVSPGNGGMWVLAEVRIGGITPGAAYAYTLDVDIVPAAAYDDVSCHAEDWTH